MWTRDDFGYKNTVYVHVGIIIIIINNNNNETFVYCHTVQRHRGIINIVSRINIKHILLLILNIPLLVSSVILECL